MDIKQELKNIAEVLPVGWIETRNSIIKAVEHIKECEEALLESDNKLFFALTEVPDFMILDSILLSGNDLSKVVFIAGWIKENWMKFGAVRQHWIRLNVLLVVKRESKADGWEKTCALWREVGMLPIKE